MGSSSNLRQRFTGKIIDEGTYTYVDAGAEQTVLEITDDVPRILHGVWLDLSTMAQNGTIKCYYKVDGTNYRQTSINGTEQSYAFTVGDTIDGVYIKMNLGIRYDFKITYTEGANEGADRDIPYQAVAF